MQIKFKRALCDNEYVEAYTKLEAELLGIEQTSLDKISDKDMAKARMSNLYEIWIDSKQVGYIGSQDYEHKASKSRMLCIINFMIKPEYRRKGYGTKALDEFIRKNKKDYYQIYCWCSEHNKDALEFYKQVGVFLVADPMAAFRITKDYTRDNLIKLDDAYAVLFFENGERYKGSELDV